MNLGISFSPLVPAYVVWAAVVVAFAISLLIVLGRTRGALVRTMALALFVLALANPSITREDRDPLTSVAVVVVDKSPSQEFGDRLQQTEAVRAALAERLGSAAAARKPSRPTGRSAQAAACKAVGQLSRTGANPVSASTWM